MKKNPPVLTLISILIDEGLTDEQLNEVQDILYEKTNKNLKEICSSIQHVKLIDGQSYVYLDPEEENCFRCENCGRWTTNHKKANLIHGLIEGRSFEGMLICSECECWKHDPEYGWSKKNEK